MELQEFFKKTYPHEKESFSKDYHIRPRIVCNDGFSFSVQASVGAYCSPRLMLEDGCYYEAEIGFPSIEEPLINQYAEDHGDYTKTVYGWVPIFIIDEVIQKHGGINKAETFKTK